MDSEKWASFGKLRIHIPLTMGTINSARALSIHGDLFSSVLSPRQSNAAAPLCRPGKICLVRRPEILKKTGPEQMRCAKAIGSRKTSGSGQRDGRCPAWRNLGNYKRSATINAAKNEAYRREWQRRHDHCDALRSPLVALYLLSIRSILVIRVHGQSRRAAEVQHVSNHMRTSFRDLDKRISRLEMLLDPPEPCNCRVETRFHSSNCLASILEKTIRECPTHGFREMGFFFWTPSQYPLADEDNQICPCNPHPWRSLVLGPNRLTW